MRTFGVQNSGLCGSRVQGRGSSRTAILFFWTIAMDSGSADYNNNAPILKLEPQYPKAPSYNPWNSSKLQIQYNAMYLDQRGSNDFGNLYVALQCFWELGF